VIAQAPDGDAPALVVGVRGGRQRQKHDKTEQQTLHRDRERENARRKREAFGNAEMESD